MGEGERGGIPTHAVEHEKERVNRAFCKTIVPNDLVSLERKISLVISENLYTHGTLLRQGSGGHARPQGFCKNLNYSIFTLSFSCPFV